MTPQAVLVAGMSSNRSPEPLLMVTPAAVVVRVPLIPSAVAVPVFWTLTERLAVSPGLSSPSRLLSPSTVVAL